MRKLILSFLLLASLNAGAQNFKSYGASRNQWTSVYQDPNIDIHGVDYNVQSALVYHAIQRDRLNPDRILFEVREGEARPSDSGVERAELSSGDNPIDHYTEIWVAYSFKVHTGAAVTGTNILGQFHAGVGSPNISWRLVDDDDFRLYLRYGDSDSYTQTIAYTDNAFVRGDWYNIVMRVIISDGDDASGEVQVWINGVEEVNLTSQITGYLDTQSTSNYWKFGNYRSTSLPETTVVEFANMEYGTADLSARINNPRDIVTGELPAPTYPEFVGAGTFTFSVGNTSPPVHGSTAIGDLMLLVVETANNNINTGTHIPIEWTQVANSPVSLTSFTRLHVFWKLYEASEPALTILDPGDHNGAQIFSFRNADSGNIPSFQNYGTFATTTSLSVSCGTTLDDYTRVIVMIAGDVDGSTTSRFDGIGTNATLSNLSHIGTGAGLNGNGGSLDVWTGELPAIGSAGTLTGTIASTGSAGAYMVIGLTGTAENPDDTPPVFNSQSIASITSTSFNLNTTTDEEATVYYVVVANAATAPSVAQVKAGDDATDSPALKSGSDSGVTLSQAITSVSSSTAYDVYFVAEDVSSNDQAAVTKLDVTTTSGGGSASTITKVPINTLNSNPDGFVIYTPADYDDSGATKYPVLYWLHGIGSNETGSGSDADLQKFLNTGGGAPQTVMWWLDQGNDVPFIVICPQDHNGYWGSRFQTFIEWANVQYADVIDVDQQHGAGLSGGGWGLRNFFRDDTAESNAFATFSILSSTWGTINSSTYWNRVIDDDQHLWWHHGDSDGTIPAATNFHDNTYAIDNTRSRYTLYIGMGHSAWKEVDDSSGRNKTQETGGNYYEWLPSDVTWWQWMLDNAK